MTPAGENLLDEAVLVHKQLSAEIRPEGAERFGARGSHVEPGRYRQHELHQRKSAYAFFVSSRPIETERGTPVVEHEDDVVQIKRLDESLEVPRLIFHAVRDLRLCGTPHANEVGGDTTRVGRDVRDDVAPDVRRRRVAVLKEYDRAFPGFDVRHLRAEHVDVFLLKLHHG
jgi:hypothetical protein